MNLRLIQFCKVLAMFVSLLFFSGCSVQGKKIYQTEQGALVGYDPVAYFLENKAVPGKAQFQTVRSNATWYFSSAKNQQLFAQTPEEYLPEYGGYCAYAMSYGLVVSSDPKAFTIIDNKLYLNYSLAVREKWLKGSEKFIIQADTKWQNKLSSVSK